MPTAAARSIPFIQRKACWCVQYKQFSVFSCWKIVLLGTLCFFWKLQLAANAARHYFSNEILKFANYPKFSIFPVTTILEVKNFFLQTADSNLQLFIIFTFKAHSYCWLQSLILVDALVHLPVAFPRSGPEEGGSTTKDHLKRFGGDPHCFDDCWWPGEGDLIIVYDWYILLKSLIYLNKWWHVTCT